MSGISIGSSAFRVFDDESIVNSSEYHSPQQDSNLPMSVVSDMAALPEAVGLGTPSVSSGLWMYPSNSNSWDRNSVTPIHNTLHDSVLESFTDKSGKYVQPVVDLSLSVNLKVADFKKWIARAWNIRESDIRKPKSSSGGRVWVAEVESLNRNITIRKYKKESEEYWKVTSIGAIHGPELVPESKRRKLEVYLPTEQGLDLMEPPSSLSSVGELPRFGLQKISETRFTPKYEIIAFTRYCISQIKKDQLENVFIETVNAANCFRPKFRPYEGEKAEHPRSEYVDYSNSDEIVNEENRMLDCISWSYRLALQRYHMFFVEFIGDSDLQRRLMKCKVDDVPNNLNPLKSVDSEVMKEVKVRTQSFTKEKRQAFIDHAAENMEYHLNVGLMNKDHIVQRDDL